MDPRPIAAWWADVFGATLEGRDDRDWWWITGIPGVPYLSWDFVPVPEPKTVKNRMHIDLAVSGEGTPEDKWRRVTSAAARLQRAGASVLTEFPGRWITMADPEGNEFDLC